MQVIEREKLDLLIQDLKEPSRVTRAVFLLRRFCLSVITA